MSLVSRVLLELKLKGKQCTEKQNEENNDTVIQRMHDFRKGLLRRPSNLQCKGIAQL